jgi:hypothetical protein
MKPLIAILEPDPKADGSGLERAFALLLRPPRHPDPSPKPEFDKTSGSDMIYEQASQ